MIRRKAFCDKMLVSTKRGKGLYGVPATKIPGKGAYYGQPPKYNEKAHILPLPAETGGKMRRLFSIFLSVILVFAMAFAGVTKIVKLKDGSVIKGEILSLNDGVYAIKTMAMGTIRVPSSNIISITDESASTSNISTNTSLPTNNLPNLGLSVPGASSPAIQSQIQQVQGTIMSNPQIMMDIQDLLNDPQLMNLVSDPAFINAIQGANPNDLGSNPELQKFMENPQVKALIQKIIGGSGASLF